MTVAQAAAGDAAAFAVIVAEHHDDMARVCFVICGNQDTAQDAVQIAWSIAWRKLGSLRSPDHLRQWLVSFRECVAANRMRSRIGNQCALGKRGRGGLYIITAGQCVCQPFWTGAGSCRSPAIRAGRYCQRVVAGA